MTAMSITEEATGGDLRRAALALHAMSAVDRAWMLGRLPAASLGTLRGHLRELQALGVPRDSSLLDVTDVEPPDEGAGPDCNSNASLAVRAAALPAERVAEALREEPASLVASLLAIQDWPWRQAVLQRLGASQARHIQEYALTAMLRSAPARDAMLMRTLIKRAASSSRASHAERHPAVRATRRRGHQYVSYVAGLWEFFSRKVAA
ncbi:MULTISPECIES: hypothetical protein [unclassified Cupriavidus]|uniref:hypothetical protein n=1 Tax=Cupriavidus sp. H19C3 TaxID=3241603 RepID=UPI003BF84661